jgi:hypothetical protein
VEWLYFNGQAGSTRFYLTFLIGPVGENGRRVAGVRLQLDRGGRIENYGETTEVDPNEVLATAPELTVGANRIRLDGDRYVVSFVMGPGTVTPQTAADSAMGQQPTRRRPRRGPAGAVGEIVLAARRGHSLPPLTITGARGWVSGYVVPVMSGALDGTIRVGDETLTLAGGTGYHDHNWGFWEGVSWQWGQVQHDGLSILYGRVFPPADAADANRIPGFLMVLGPDGPLGQATRVTIDETIEPTLDRPNRIAVRGNSPSLDLRLEVDVESAIRTPWRSSPLADGLDFPQMRGRYRVSGKAGDRALDFDAPGAAETFRSSGAASRTINPR